jgi:hypothetical protein
MIFRTLGWLAGTLALATLLLVTGCKTSGPTEPSGPNLTGGWITQTINGQDVASLGMSAQFSGNQVTFTSADGCQSLNTYTTSGNKIILTVVNDPCTGDPVGKKDTVNYTLAGDQLTIAQGGQTIVMKKGQWFPRRPFWATGTSRRSTAPLRPTATPSP